ncbi:hypothetical protein ACOZB2_30575, partial [Pantoea endophytica]
MEKWLSRFSGQNQYQLDIHNAAVRPDVLRFRGREALSEPFRWDIRALQNGLVMTLVTFIAARDSRLHVSVWGMPYSEHFCFRPATVPRPEIVGTHLARIESRNADDIYAYLDETGRYRVKLD